MKHVALYFVAAFLAGVGTVYAQVAAAIPATDGAVVAVPGTYGYPYEYVMKSTTPFEGYARGIADVIRSEGLYNLDTSAAAVNFSEARRREIENAKRWTETYFEIRDINRQVFNAEQRRLRATPEEWIRYAQAGRPRRLGPSELDSVTGQIRWPMLLTGQDFSAYRVELEKAFTERAYHGVMAADSFLRVMRLTEDLIASLKDRIYDVPADKYVNAKRFLESLAYEAGQPAG